MSPSANPLDETLLAFLRPIAALLRRPSISEIMINGYDTIYVEERGQLRLTTRSFGSEHALMAALRSLSQYAGRELNDLHPILEASLPDGSRVEALIPPAARFAPVVTIRRLSSEPLTIERLVELGALTLRASEILRHVIDSKRNVLVAGPPGSGKSTLLCSLSRLLGRAERVVLIEDSPELRLPHPHVVSLQTRAADARGCGAVTHADLLKAASRLRPDRLILGELRGGEAMGFIDALAAGHGGCLTTLDARSAADALARLESLALSGATATRSRAPSFLCNQIGKAIDGIVVVGWSSPGVRCVSRIVDVLGYDPAAGYVLADRFVREESPAGGAPCLA